MEEYTTPLRTNSFGFRGPEFPIERQPGELRILFLGDSFVEAKQVKEEERFPEQTGVLLSAILKRPVTVRAMGIGGADPPRELLFYRRIGYQFDPDIVIQVLFPENDALPLQGNHYKFNTTGSSPTLEHLSVPIMSPCPWKCWLMAHSRLLSLAYRTLRPLWQSLSRESLSFADRLHDYFLYTTKGQQWMEEEKVIDTFVGFASALQHDVTDHNGRTFFILMPGAFEIEEWSRNTVTKQYETTVAPSEWNSGFLLDEIAGRFREEHLLVLDLRPAFHTAKEKTNEELYFRLDPHLSRIGHNIAARTIVEFLIGQDRSL